MSSMSAIIIVNWNCWEDTVRCINACGHLAGFSGGVLVVDNNSTDDSLKVLQDWGKSPFVVPTTSSSSEIATLEAPASDPLRFECSGDEAYLSEKIRLTGLAERSWYLVSSNKNGGFGAGNNIGLRLAMRDPKCSLFWCLNADAIPQRGAWAELMSVCSQHTTPCVAGSVLLNYDRPDTIQTIGSFFSRVTLKADYQRVNEPASLLETLPQVLAVDYPIGASLILNRDFLAIHGGFDERYFLYYEEPDLVIRLKEGAQSFICTRSRVYHKGGQTTGGGQSVSDRSKRADYEYQRSKVILARKIGGISAAMVVFAAVFSIIRRLKKGRWDLAKEIPKAFLNGWFCVK